MKCEPVVKVENLEGDQQVVFTTRFDVFLRSSPEGQTQPFPGCDWNVEERRWEWSCGLVTTLLGLIRGLGCPVLIHPLATTEGDLDILEVVDVDADEVEEDAHDIALRLYR